MNTLFPSTVVSKWVLTRIIRNHTLFFLIILISLSPFSLSALGQTKSNSAKHKKRSESKEKIVLGATGAVSEDIEDLMKPKTKEQEVIRRAIAASYRSQGLSQSASGKYSEAIDSFTKAIANDGELAESLRSEIANSFFNLAIYQREIGKYEDSAQSFCK